jgi:hypothetical protein
MLKDCINTLLFRLLGVPLPVQNEIYVYMMDLYEVIVRQNKKLGIYEEGAIGK